MTYTLKRDYKNINYPCQNKSRLLLMAISGKLFYSVKQVNYCYAIGAFLIYSLI